MKGQCYCGTVQFTLDGEFGYAFFCHCSRCRRRTGSACAAIGGIETEKVRFIAGAELTARIGESPKGYRCLCGRCYSPLYDVVRDGQFAHVQLGTLDDSSIRGPDHHIFVGCKAPWYVIGDDFPRHDGFSE